MPSSTTPSININNPDAAMMASSPSTAFLTNGSFTNTPLSSSINASNFAAAVTFRRPSLAVSAGSFHAAQLRRPSFFAPFPYNMSPQHSDLVSSEFGSSPRVGGDIYQRDLETNYCKNFSCCGLTLNDLHALLQHYEEAHVRFEDDDVHPAGSFDDEDWSTSSESVPNSPQPAVKQLNHHYHNQLLNNPIKTANPPTLAAAAAANQHKLTPLSLLNSRKKGNGVSLSDIYAEDPVFQMDEASAFPNSILRSTQPRETTAAKKRDLATYSTSFDKHSPLSKKATTHQNHPSGLSHSIIPGKDSAIKVNASSSSTASIPSNSTTSTSSLKNSQDTQVKSTSNNGSGSSATNSESAPTKSLVSSLTPAQQDEMLNTITGYLEQAIQQGILPTGQALAAEDLIRKRDEIMSMMESIGRSGSSGADKPYRCTVDGCDKAYKNPNGLKYHNQHGHCSVPGSAEDDKLNAKPYRCTFLECGKCYKNLNGLKYHIEHSHPNLAAALHAHIPGFATMDGNNVSQAAIAAAAAIAAVQANPMMMAAASAIMASASNNSNRQSPPSSASDHTPDSSPNSSPVLAASDRKGAQSATLAADNKMQYRNADPILSTDVTPMTSPILSNAPLSIKTSGHNQVPGLVTPLTLSPTSTTAPRSPTSGTQVSNLTAALAAVSVEQQRLQQQQQHTQRK
ncbi:hypothetical protein BGW41_007693 [Actinomortierella wolfii]|nr:hypothetical protein BGW41_007693 [Actinomortierella wolfii]